MISEERQLVEKHEGWNKWCANIPKLHFKEDWEVRVIPPFIKKARTLITFVMR